MGSFYPHGRSRLGSRLLSLTCSHPDSCVYLGFESQDRILLIYSFLSGCQREVNKKLKFISIGALIANNKMEIISMAFDFFFKCYVKTLFAFAWFITIFTFYHLPSSPASSSFIPPDKHPELPATFHIQISIRNISLYLLIQQYFQ